MVWPFKPSESHAESTRPESVQHIIDRYREETGYAIDWAGLATMAMRYADTNDPSYGMVITGKVEALARGGNGIQQDRLKQFVGDVVDARQKSAARGA